MGNKGRSTPGLFGGYNNYDSKGNKVGRSTPGLFGGYNTYDKDGRKTGYSTPGFFGGYNHYDSSGKKIGHSSPGMFGSMNHYDSSGKRTGSSTPGMFGGYNHSSSDGCYVATCVYGSYDCPEVWTLRRFRDIFLAQHLLGRAFIHAYYAVSPTIVKWFGNTRWFQNFWRRRLDKLVSCLHTEGVQDTPYEDRNWRVK